MIAWQWVAVGVVLLAGGGAPCSPEVPVVTTDKGRVCGLREQSTKNVSINSYYAIPFAAPPVGDLRFQRPQPAHTWQGVRNGTTSPSGCLDLQFALALVGVKVSPPQITGSEDCLYLNVHAPQGRTGLPVMVYVHGGGFYSGQASPYNPYVLLNHPVVLVVLQYRLGVLGFLSTEDTEGPGNYGLWDAVEGLRWVQRNIHHFGGDPRRVTIFGESAGSVMVHSMVLSPHGAGLFWGAIMQSGSALAPFLQWGAHRETAQAMGATFGCHLEKGSEAFLACLKTIDGQALAAAIQDTFVWSIVPLIFVPRVDGDFLPVHPAQLLREGRYNHVNLISGINSHEGTLQLYPILAVPQYQELLVSNFSTIGPLSLMCCAGAADPLAITSTIYDHYLGAPPASPLDFLHKAEQLMQMFGDHYFTVPHDLISQLHAEKGTVYMYELTHRAELSLGDYFVPPLNNNWVSHGDDLYYLFRGDQLSAQPTLSDLQRPQDLTLRNIITALWTNFATTGNPTPDASLGFTWEPTTSHSLTHLVLKPSPHMRKDYRAQQRSLLTSLPTHQNNLFNPRLLAPQTSYLPPPPVSKSFL